jgi:hypothetical protein
MFGPRKIWQTCDWAIVFFVSLIFLSTDVYSPNLWAAFVHGKNYEPIHLEKNVGCDTFWASF